MLKWNIFDKMSFMLKWNIFDKMSLFLHQTLSSDHSSGHSIGFSEEIRILVNQYARLTTLCGALKLS